MPSRLPPNVIEAHGAANSDEAGSHEHQQQSSPYLLHSVVDAGTDVRELITAMQERCSQILDELAVVQNHLKEKKRENSLELRTFRSAVQSEKRMIDNLAQADPDNPRTLHGLRSSNLVFYSAVWSATKTCTAVTALSKNIYRKPAETSQPRSRARGGAFRNNQRHTGVDIVANNGLEWIKVSAVTEKRVIWDLAKAGWVGSSSDEDEDKEEEEGASSQHEDDSDGLLKQAEILVAASKVNRTHYRLPEVRLVLPRISSHPASKEVANFIQQIRNLGVTVQTSDELPQERGVTEVLYKMTAERHEPLSETLNIDCTILLAFVSDLSYGTAEPACWHTKQLSRQMEMEKEDQLLSASLWPICGSRRLVCTREAATTMQKLVNLIGTDTERKRTDLIFNTNALPRGEVLQKLQELSHHKIPTVWNVPVEIVDIDLEEIVSQCPSGAKDVLSVLSPINQSVFLYGWAMNLTTISSNAVAAKEIESTIEKHRGDEEIRGPDIWLSPASRSLVGKEKQRR